MELFVYSAYCCPPLVESFVYKLVMSLDTKIVSFETLVCSTKLMKCVVSLIKV